MGAARSDDVDWRGARTFSLVYNPGEEVMELVKRAYQMFMVENALGPTAFPSLRRFETEVVAMAADLLGGDDQTVGTMTSGGTESIFMAVKTARDHRVSSRGPTAPGGGPWQLVVPASAHPAFDKAAHYLGLEVVHIPLGEDLRANVEATRAVVNERTMMMVGSAPGYPHGVVDPIEQLSSLAKENNIWFHCDCCLGGFLLPFVRDLGYPVPSFDFTLPGVTSISADLHKYGYAAKGASTVLYRNESYRRHQFYVQADWCGGIYATPSLAGARTGGSVAAAWAVLHFLGREGYLRLAKEMMETTGKLLTGIGAIDGLKILGAPEMTVFAVGSDELNVYALADALASRRWYVERQHLPPALHLMVSPAHSAVADEFLGDLAAATAEVEGMDRGDISQVAAVYGMLGTMPDRAAAGKMALEIMAELFRA
jgi:glutamate/tyrosine decarboxylase-like PLP-dependent enzyme